MTIKHDGEERLIKEEVRALEGRKMNKVWLERSGWGFGCRYIIKKVKRSEFLSKFICLNIVIYVNFWMSKYVI